MKDIIKSLQIFTSSFTPKKVLTSVGICAICYAVIAVFGIVGRISLEYFPDTFLAGFFFGFTPCLTLVIPFIGMGIISVVSNANNPINPGYKYFHSIYDGENHFKRAVIGSNIAALLIMAAGIPIIALYNYLFFNFSLSLLLTPIVALMGIGLVNFSGYVKGSAGKLLLILPSCLAGGFIAGFTTGMSEDGETVPEIVLYIALAVAMAVFAAGFIFSLCKCKKYWRADK